MKLVFLAWAPHGRRSQLLARRLGGTLCLVHYLRFKYPLCAPFKYVLQAAKTWASLRELRPDAVFVQNPPIFSVLAAYLYCRLAGARYVIDSHTGAFTSPRWRWSLPWHRFFSRRALTTMVTNEHLSRQVETWGAPSLVIRDVPVTFGQGRPFSTRGDFVITVVNTFSQDEPLEEVLEAASSLPEVAFYVTGSFQARERSFSLSQPPNVTFTGFIDDQDYIGLLRASHAVMALTTSDHTMQRGACEALSLGKPIITSDWGLLKDYFNKGAVHVDNSSKAIGQGVLLMRGEWQRLAQEIQELRTEREQEWQEKEAILCALLEGSQVREKR